LIALSEGETNTGAVGALLFVIDNFSSKTKLVGLSLFTAAGSNLVIYPLSALQRIIALLHYLTTNLPSSSVKTIPEFGFEKTFTFARGLKSTALTTLPSTVPNSSNNFSSLQEHNATNKAKYVILR
jgi:hypothetical protein